MPDLQQVGDRVETLLSELRASGDPVAASKAEELVRLLMELYGAGLERIVEIVVADERTDALAAAFADDPLVASLLALHDLHPVPIETRVRQAVECYGAELVGIDDAGVARVRIEGGDARAVERAVLDAAPELAHVVVTEAPARTFLQIQPLRSVGS